MLGSDLNFSLRTLRERLWIKPLGYAILAVVAVLLTQFVDDLPIAGLVPDISSDTIEKLLTVISASMLGVATFAVASMVSAYASAGSSATPRAFTLIIADGRSQTALSSFIGAFIFSIVGIITIKVGYFGIAGRFAIFLLTIAIFTWVVVTFVHWVNSIARLGRLANTIEKVDAATREAFEHWHPGAPLAAQPSDHIPAGGLELCAQGLGYIQQIDTARLDKWASANNAVIYVQSRPGAFVDPQRALLKVFAASDSAALDTSDLHTAFVLEPRRSFARDPRFGLIALSEIGSRALSPGVNDPGTAIDIVVRLSRIIFEWRAAAAQAPGQPECERVFVMPLDPHDLLEDAYAAIAKDGVNAVEVGIWIQKSLSWIVARDDDAVADAAQKMATLAFDRAEAALSFAPDLDRVRRAHRQLQERSKPRAGTVRSSVDQGGG